MLSERIRNAPLLTFDDAVDLFEAAIHTLPEQFSWSDLLLAYEREISCALAVSAGEGRTDVDEVDRPQLSNTTV